MTTTIFDYWISEHQCAYNWVLNKLRSEGVNGTVDGETVIFNALDDNPSALAEFLDGRTYNYLNWVEVGATLDDPAPDDVIASKKRGRKRVDTVVETVPEPVVVVPTPEPEPEPEPQPLVVEPVVEAAAIVVEPQPDVVPAAEVVKPKTIMDFDANKDGKLDANEVKAYTDYLTQK